MNLTILIAKGVLSIVLVISILNNKDENDLNLQIKRLSLIVLWMSCITLSKFIF
jgi:hypothetical protein